MKKVQAKAGFPPRRIGIIGGSGLYQIEGLTKQKWVRVNTPFGPPSDRLLTGEIAGRELVFLPRHGRSHHLLPSELNHRANIWAMKKLGVAWIISVSAVGSLQSRYRPRDIVFVNQFVDRTKKSSEHTFFHVHVCAAIVNVGFYRAGATHERLPQFLTHRMCERDMLHDAPAKDGSLDRRRPRPFDSFRG